MFTAWSRSSLQISASVVDGSFVIAAAYAGCDAMLVGAFFALAVGAQGLQTSSIMVNPLDLSPNYSGMITGITGAISCCMGVLVPVIIGILAPNVSHAIFFYFKLSAIFITIYLFPVPSIGMAIRILDYICCTYM